jgi:hypothetical protein
MTFLGISIVKWVVIGAVYVIPGYIILRKSATRAGGSSRFHSDYRPVDALGSRTEQMADRTGS